MVDNGMNRIHAQLEIDNFIKTMLQVKVALKTLFNKAEIFLLHNNHTFTINSSENNDGDSCSSSNECL